MTSDQLLDYELPQLPGTLRKRSDEQYAASVRAAVAAGLLHDPIDKTPALLGNNVWTALLVLTDEAGRVAAGLEPIRPAAKERMLFD